MMLTSHYQRRRSTHWRIVLLIFAWMSLEYVRGELYYLKFTWATPGRAFSSLPESSILGAMGVYGTGGICMALASTTFLFSKKHQLLWLTGITISLGLIVNVDLSSQNTNGESLPEIQFPGEEATLHASLRPSSSSRIPLDRYLIWICLGIIAFDLLKHLAERMQRKNRSR